MRPLTEDETRMVFEKLHKFIGKNIKSLVDGSGEDQCCLRLQKGRVYYVREDIMKRATNVGIFCLALHCNVIYNMNTFMYMCIDAISLFSEMQ
jgi:ribosome biogenesis protein Nip4